MPAYTIVVALAAIWAGVQAFRASWYGLGSCPQIAETDGSVQLVHVKFADTHRSIVLL
jgi:hypothetical protein